MIMNPTVPLALRLSAQLLLGTVRIYRTKTKLCLGRYDFIVTHYVHVISDYFHISVDRVLDILSYYAFSKTGVVLKLLLKIVP